MDKRAMSETMVNLLFLVIAALVLFTFTYSFANLLKEDVDIEACRASVLLQSQTRKIPVVGSGPKTIVSLDCPRRKLKIFENKVEINVKKSEEYKFKKLTSDEVNHILAEELRSCWYKMFEGNEDVFENSYFFDFHVPNICLICSEIEFDNELRGRAFDGLLEYLKSKNIPKEKITYFDYLIKSQKGYPLYGLSWDVYDPWGYADKLEKPAVKLIITDQKYIIYFLAYKPPWLSQLTGKSIPLYYLGLGKEDKLAEECNELVN